jgi:anti-sigma B factor antagonist
MVEPELRVILDPASESADSWPVLRVFGEVDIQTSPILDEQLRSVLNEGVSSIIVDLGGVTFLDSTGVSVLIAGLKRCQNARGDMRLVSPRPNVRKVLEITGLIEVFHLHAPDEENA